MKYSAKLFRDTMPEWKRKKDSIVARYFHRPISFYFSSIFSSIGLTPNQVSFISLIIAFLACACFLVDNKKFYILGAILINLWSITDSADGNMARTLGGKPYGDFIDATSSYALVGFMFPAIAVAVYRGGGIFFEAGNAIIIYIGAIVSASDTMSRLFFQKMKNNTMEINIERIKKGEKIEDLSETMKESKIGKIQTIIDSELGIGGWCMVAIFICILTRSLDLYILFYALYYVGFFIFSLIYMIRKTKCLKS